MTNYKPLLITVLLAFSASLQAATVDTLTVRIKGMKCGECAHKVMKAVRQLPGIDNVVSNTERRTTTVTFDPAQTCADSICARLDATGRFKPSAYSPQDTIMRGIGLYINDMHCQNCANRITQRLEQMAGIDSLAPHIDKHYVFVRYDANRTSKADIKEAVVQLGFTPVNYYTGKKISYAYYNIGEGQATAQTFDEVLAIDGVEDVCVNSRRNSLAVTFFNDEITADKLLSSIREAGIDATIPAPHECKEEQK